MKNGSNYIHCLDLVELKDQVEFSVSDRTQIPVFSSYYLLFKRYFQLQIN